MNVKITSILLLVCGIISTIQSLSNNDITLNAREAKTFLKRSSRHRRDLKSDVREECCKEACDFGEIVEMVFKRKYPAPKLKKEICQQKYDNGKNCRVPPLNDPILQMFFKGLPDYSKPACKPVVCKCDGRETHGGWIFKDLKYDFSKAKVDGSPDIQSAPIINNGLDITVQKTATVLKRTVTVTEEEWFEKSEGTTLSASASFTFGVPKLGFGGSISTTLTTSKTFTVGKKKTRTETREAQFTCPWIPGKFVVCDVYFVQKSMRVPYRMNIKNKVYGCECSNTGVFKRVHSSGFHQRILEFDHIPQKYRFIS